jgi:hypothetical protein
MNTSFAVLWPAQAARLRSGALLCAAAMAVSGLVWANHGPSITYSVTAQQSSTGVSPSSNGGNWVYQFTVTDGDSLTATLPVAFCLETITEGTIEWQSVTFSFPVSAGNLPGVTVPGNVGFTKAADGNSPPICKTANIQIATGALTLSDPAIAENRNRNINISASGLPGNPHGLNLGGSTPNIHVQVAIQPRATHAANCYITDSSGAFLADCAGTPVTDSGSYDGRFAIVANKKNTAVSTNPGQFYYNVTWENTTGSAQTVDVDFERAGVNPKGAQAIHAAVFEPLFGGVTPVEFEVVNDSIPGASDDAIEGIVVPAGWTLWVNYHLEWDGLGSTLSSTCTSNCADAGTAGAPFQVVATITGGAGSGISETCDSGAAGYRKK